MTRHIIALTLATFACRDVEVRPSSAQAVGPGGLQRMLVLDGGLCVGNGSSGDPFHCDLTVDDTVGGTGSAGAPLNTTAPVATFTYALFGDASDGTFVFDGSTTFVDRRGVSHAPASSVYTQTNDVFCHGCTINVGVTVRPAGFRFFDDATLTLNGKIERNGNNASGVTGGGSLSTTSFYNAGGVAGGNGGAGGGGACVAGTNTANNIIGSGTGLTCSNSGGAAGNPGTNGGACKGGGGGTGGNGAACAAGTITVDSLVSTNFRELHSAASGRSSKATATAYRGGSGGGGGRGASTPSAFGGGGGGGGGPVGVFARAIVGSGSVESKGGNGANGEATTNSGGGGGGGGGAVVIIVGSSPCPTTAVTGGTHGNGNGTGGNGGDGGSGFARCYVLGQ